MSFDFEKELEEMQKKKEAKRQKFLQKASDKMNDGELCFYSFVLLIAERYNLGKNSDVANILANHFIENVDEPFSEWINKNDAPFVRPLSSARKIFHEFSFLEDDEEIIELANKLYNLDLKVSEEYRDSYMYSFSFDFNSFTPLKLDGLKELKEEIRILEKHNVDCSELKRELESYGLSDEELELI